MLDQGTLLSQRYRIRGVLGQGGMGAVYLAEAEALGGKKVAVKEMIPWGLPPGELDQAVAQFKKEAAFLAGLEHPNVVRVADFFVEEGKHYLVMDYIQGETLQEKMASRGRPFHWYELETWVQSLMDVLEYLHSQDPPIIFRDLKPSNIMVSVDGRLNLIDFGIARSACQGEKTTTFLQGTGTRGFSPIEQYGNQQSTDQRSDIYALGATLYYLLTATLPPDAVQRVSRRTEIVPLSERNPDIPGRLDDIVEKAMGLAAEDRYQSIAEFRNALNGSGRRRESSKSEVQVAPVATRVDFPTVLVRPARRETLTWRGWATAAGCLLLTGSLWMSLSSHSQAADFQVVDHKVEAARVAEQSTSVSFPLVVESDEEPSQSLPDLSTSDTEEPPEAQAKEAETSDPPDSTAAPRKRMETTLGLESYPKARLSTAPMQKDLPEVVVSRDSPVWGGSGVIDNLGKAIESDEPVVATGPEQTGPSGPGVQAPIYVMPPGETAIQSAASSQTSVAYQTSTQWASRGQSVDPTQSAAPGGPSLTNVPAATSLAPGLAKNEPAGTSTTVGPGKKGVATKQTQAISKSTPETQKKSGGKSVASNLNSKSESNVVASNKGGEKKSGEQPKPKGDQGVAGKPPPPPPPANNGGGGGGHGGR